MGLKQSPIFHSTVVSLCPCAPRPFGRLGASLCGRGQDRNWGTDKYREKGVVSASATPPRFKHWPNWKTIAIPTRCEGTLRRSHACGRQGETAIGLHKTLQQRVTRLQQIGHNTWQSRPLGCNKEAHSPTWCGSTTKSSTQNKPHTQEVSLVAIRPNLHSRPRRPLECRKPYSKHSARVDVSCYRC